MLGLKVSRIVIHISERCNMAAVQRRVRDWKSKAYIHNDRPLYLTSDIDMLTISGFYNHQQIKQNWKASDKRFARGDTKWRLILGGAVCGARR